jgi:hypothetical protein
VGSSERSYGSKSTGGGEDSGEELNCPLSTILIGVLGFGVSPACSVPVVTIDKSVCVEDLDISIAENMDSMLRDDSDDAPVKCRGSAGRITDA